MDIYMYMCVFGLSKVETRVVGFIKRRDRALGLFLSLSTEGDKISPFVNSSLESQRRNKSERKKKTARQMVLPLSQTR